MSYIDEHGKYIRGKTKNMRHDINSMHKSWSHDQQRKEFAREIIQPHRQGKPNPDFIRAYPEYSKKYFTPQQIIDYEREL
jgi:hypothetical protein